MQGLKSDHFSTWGPRSFVDRIYPSWNFHTFIHLTRRRYRGLDLMLTLLIDNNSYNHKDNNIEETKFEKVMLVYL